MTKYTHTVHSTDATATEGWSGVQDRELKCIEAAIAWFAAEVAAEPLAVHSLKFGEIEIAKYDPLWIDDYRNSR